MSKTTKPAMKTPGQIAHEAGEKHDGWSRRWSDCSESQKAAWELIAADIAKAATLAERERCHELVSEFPMRTEFGGKPYWNDKCKSMAFAMMVRIKCPDFDDQLEKGRPQ